MTLIILYLVYIPFFVKAGLLIAVLVSTYRFWRQYPHYQFLTTDGTDWVLYTGKEEIRGALRGDSMVTAWIMVLRLAVPGKKGAVSCVLFPDAVPAQVWRRLRVLAADGSHGQPR